MDYKFTNLEEAIFVKRDNRFRAEISINNQSFKAHVPNSGRMAELLINGTKVWVRKAEDEARKTPYDLLLVEKERIKVCLNAHYANHVFAKWLKLNKLEEFSEVISWQREKTYGNSRIDFLLNTAQTSSLVEIKSVNLVQNREAMFPDAPTVRGTKHLEELAHYLAVGHKAAVVFIIMREDADVFKPNDAMDPVFGNTLRKVHNEGVAIYAYKCLVSQNGLSYGGKIPVIL